MHRRVAEDRRRDDAGLDDGDANAERRDLERERFAERLDGELGGAVGRLVHRGDAAEDRRHVDDRAAAALAHPREHRLGEADRPPVVGLEERPVLVLRVGLGGAGVRQAGVVDQHVDAALGLDDLRHRGGDRAGVGHVERLHA